MEDIKIIHEFKKANEIFMIVESTKKSCKCPNCDKTSDTIHSKYTRKIFNGSLIYKSSIDETILNAKQISDKFHLIKNLLDAVSKYVKRKYPIKILLSTDVQKDGKGDLKGGHLQ